MITPSDLLDPVGPLQAGLFPSDSAEQLEARLLGYITIGLDKTTAIVDPATRDQAVFYYSLYRAWDAVYSMLIARPSEIRQDGDSTTKYTQAQLNAAREARDAALGQYEGIVAVVGNTVAEVLPPTQHTANRYAY